MAAVSFIGLFEIFFIIGGGATMGSSGLLGVPPAERDSVYVQCAPQDTLIYLEWAARTSGKEGAIGVDGLVADPEVVYFLKQTEKYVLSMIAAETEESGDEDIAKAVAPLVKDLFFCSGTLYASYDVEAVKKLKELEEKSEEGSEEKPEEETFNNLQQRGPPDVLRLMAGLRATLIFNGKDRADAIENNISKLLEQLPENERTVDLKKQKLPIPVPPGLPAIFLHREGDYFILTQGEAGLTQAIAGLKGTATSSISENKKFFTKNDPMFYERTAFIQFVDIKGVVSKLTTAMGNERANMIVGAMALLGADAIDSVKGTLGVVDGQIHSKALLTTNGKTEGILALAAGRPIQVADFQHVPLQADLVSAFSLNLETIVKTTRTIVEKADPNSGNILDRDIKRIEEEFGIKLDDFFAAFGDVWTVYDAPETGGLVFSGITATLEVKDEKKAKQIFAKLMTLLDAMLPGEQEPRRYRGKRRGVFLQKNEFLGATIHHVNTIGNDVPFAPAFCLKDGKLYAALHPMTLKAQLRFLADQEKNFTEQIGKECEVNLKEGDHILVTYSKSRAVIKYIYAFLPYFGSIMTSNMQAQIVKDTGFDSFAIPSARAILPYLKNTSSSIKRTPQGLYFESRNEVPFASGSLFTMIPQLLLMGVNF